MKRRNFFVTIAVALGVAKARPAPKTTAIEARFVTFKWGYAHPAFLEVWGDESVERWEFSSEKRSAYEWGVRAGNEIGPLVRGRVPLLLSADMYFTGGATSLRDKFALGLESTGYAGRFQLKRATVKEIFAAQDGRRHPMPTVRKALMGF